MGTYEKILRSVLDDPTLTDAEARLIGHLATRPPGWVVIPSVVAKDIKRNERYWVRPTLRLLAARGIITAVRDRGERAQFSSVTYLVNREELTAPNGEQNPRSEPATASQSMVPPAETYGEQENPQVGPRAASQSMVPPAETQKPRSDHGLPDRARSNNRRERTDKEPRTKNPLPAEQQRQLSLVSAAGPEPAPERGKTTAKRGTQIPPDLVEKLRADKVFVDWFRRECPLVDGREMTMFVNHAVSHGRVLKDWTAGARNWMLKAQREAEERKAKARPEPGDDGWVQPVTSFRGMS
jgi:hypothetical protein